MNDLIATEVAEADFNRLCAARRVDIDEAEMDEEDLEKFHDLKTQIVKQIRRGRLVVTGDDGTCVYTPPNGKAITFYPTVGAHLMAQDDHAEGRNMAKTAAVFTAMTKSNKGDFAKLDLADVKACQALVGLFLAAG